MTKPPATKLSKSRRTFLKRAGAATLVAVVGGRRLPGSRPWGLQRWAR